MRIRPEHIAAVLVALVFLVAVGMAMVEAAHNRANLALCPLCEQEVKP